CEEITFRLLLQGWLEKWEDQRLACDNETQSELPASDEILTTNDAPAASEISSFDPRHSPSSSPTQRATAGLPHGWIPIIISATMFGLAHLGYGPEPVPLFLLGVVLGYLYQRTHRLLPSIIAHALFNLFTVVSLWRMSLHAN